VGLFSKVVYSCAWITQFTIIKYHPSQYKCSITLPNNLFSISWSESYFFIDVVLYNFFCVWITLSSNSFQFMDLKIESSKFRKVCFYAGWPVVGMLSVWCVTWFIMEGIVCWNICRCLSYLSFTSSVEACLVCSHVTTSSTF